MSPKIFSNYVSSAFPLALGIAKNLQKYPADKCTGAAKTECTYRHLSGAIGLTKQ
jgi:hypothetical protein